MSGFGWRRAAAPLVVALTFVLAAPRSWAAQSMVPYGFSDSLIVSGLDLPAGIAFLPDGRLLVVEQFTARIRVVVRGAFAPVDTIALPGVRNAPYTEQGLLGIAVDPGFPARPYVYVHCDDASSPTIRVSRYQLGGDLNATGDGSLTLDPATRYDLIDDVPDVQANHNGGTLRFGTDGMLYASFGEDNQFCPAQDTTSLLGKILRLDVSRLPAGAGGPAPRALVTPADNPFVNHPNANARLVWAFGFRNPFRFQVDPLDGALFVGDVGQSAFEEIDRVALGGHNFGWPLREGPAAYDSGCPGLSAGDAPIAYYDRSGFTAAVISAGPYRRPVGATDGFPAAYEGDAFFSDYYAGFLRRLEGAGATWTLAPPVAGQPTDQNWGEGFTHVSDYLVGPDGALWYCRQYQGQFPQANGEIRAIVALTSVPIDTLPPTVGPFEFQVPVPSPAQNAVRLAFTLPIDLPVTLTLFDLGGRRVRRLLREAPLSAGPHALSWDGRTDDGFTARSGVYVARLRAGGHERTRRVVLAR